MEFSIARESLIFLGSALAGVILFFTYDLFRLIRLHVVSPPFMVHVQDFLFWMAGFAILFFSLFYINNGILRFYEFLGVFLGAILYKNTLSTFILNILNRFLGFFSKVFKLFLKILLTPLIFMYNILYRCLCFFAVPVKKAGRMIAKNVFPAVKRTGRLIRKK